MNVNDNKILSIISANSPLGDDIQMNDELSAIGIDSLKKVNLVVALEDVLNIRFSDSDLNPAKLSTVHDVVELVQQYLG